MLLEQAGRGEPTERNGVNMVDKNNPPGTAKTRNADRRPGFGDHLDAKSYESLKKSETMPNEHKYTSL